MAKKTAKNPRGLGQETQFTEKLIEQARAVVRLGGTDADIAAALGFSVPVICKWKKQFPAFGEALKSAKEDWDNAVVVSLQRRAVGYSHPDVDIRTVSIGDGMSKIVETPIIKHYPPDPTSCIFWLKNRQPDKWRDRREVTGADGGAIKTESATFDPSKLSVAELLQLQTLLGSAKKEKQNG